MRRVSTKSSLQSNYIPTLEKLIEEPSILHEVCRQDNKNVDSRSVGVIERKDLSEVVVSHWSRAEQQRSDSRLTTCQSGSFENGCPPSSLGLVNEVTEEILFRRSSTNVSKLKGITSRFMHLEKFSLNFSNSSIAILVNLLHP